MPGLQSGLQSDGIVLVFNISLDGADSKQSKGKFSADMCLFLQLSGEIRL